MIRTLEVSNKLGLHARAAAKVVSMAGRFRSRIFFREGRQRGKRQEPPRHSDDGVSAGSLVTVRADGDDAAEAIERSRAFSRRSSAKNNPMKSQQEKHTVVLRGVAVSPGIAIGKAFHFDHLESQVALYKIRDKSQISHEIKRFRDSVAASIRQLREIRRKLGRLEGMDPLYVWMYTSCS
jgi:phosphotransferase system HPr-like phosphotransfer protein